MKYFSYDPINGGYGFEIHDTAEQAKCRAEQVLSDFIDVGWYEDGPDEIVQQVCWGEISEIVNNELILKGHNG